MLPSVRWCLIESFSALCSSPAITVKRDMAPRRGRSRSDHDADRTSVFRSCLSCTRIATDGLAFETRVQDVSVGAVRVVRPDLAKKLGGQERKRARICPAVRVRRDHGGSRHQNAAKPGARSWGRWGSSCQRIETRNKAGWKAHRKASTAWKIRLPLPAPADRDAQIGRAGDSPSSSRSANNLPVRQST